MGPGGRMVDAPVAPLGARSVHGDHAVDPHAVSCLLATRVLRWHWPARDGHGGPLYLLERAAPHQRYYAPAGHLLLGPVHLPDRQYSPSRHRTGSAHAYNWHSRLFNARA